MKIAFGIMGYDSWEEFKISSDIIKSFSKKYYVLAASSHKDCKKNLKYSNIDEVYHIDPIPINPKLSRDTINWHARVADNISKTNLKLINKNRFDYIIFLHSDAWILKHDSILKLISDLKNKNKFFAARGRGFGFHSKSSPMGSLDDMFFIYNSKFIKKSKLFEFDALQQLPHIQNSHGIIVSNLVTKVGPNNVHIYSDTSKLYFYKNKFLTEKTNKFKFTNHTTPAIYDPKYAMIHIHTGAFTKTIGKSLQAYYLKKYKLSGPSIKLFNEKYSVDNKFLFNQIKSLDKNTKRLLRLNLISYDSLGYGKNYTKIINLLKNINFKKRLKLIIKCWIRAIVIKLISREKYYNYFYGYIDINSFYNKNLLYKKEINHLGFKEWYKN